MVQKHFLCTTYFYNSSYSFFVIHIGSNLSMSDKIAPPSQQEYFLSAGASTSGPIGEGARAWISFFILAYIPSNIVQPPAKTMFLKRSLLMSLSHLMIESCVNLWIPSIIFPARTGWNKSSVHLIYSSLIGREISPGSL